MIQATEIRIGNWVMSSIGPHRLVPYDIVSIIGGEVLVNPVPLTEDILSKCGFEVQKSADIYEYDVYSIQISNNKSLCYCKHPLRNSTTGEETISDAWWFDDFYGPSFTNFGNDFWRKPNNLHQLQNLYYALTGEELNVEL